ncbi:MAG TPA: tripartite tricarboxylate transporter substrate-binding protein [Hyphomicrobiaceae bacterium]|nr:tripartite tricarboxylate transporter substrate-binding protein [Hyphomicrobiaceae bacterium]
MRVSRHTITRRGALKGAAAAGAAGFLGSAAPFGALAQQKYPSRKFSVVIPTGQGGGAERLVRAFDVAWSKLLGQPFEYEFHPGAAGQVGYTLYVQKRPRDGHNLLFGNMGPEMIMYALQNPDYKFPQDYIYFCRTDIDDSCVFVRADSPFKKIEDVVAEAKKRPLNVATSRIPHPASIGILALGDATKSKFNLIPYGGGNPTQVAVMNGEVDIGVLPIVGIIRLGDKMRILGLFNDTNMLPKETNNAPLINNVFGTKIPDLSSSRSWAIHTEWADKNPAEFKLLVDTSKKVFDDPEFKSAAEKAGVPQAALAYGDRKVCTQYALAMVELANRYKSILSAKETKKG